MKFGGRFDVDKKLKRLEEIKFQESAPDFWNHQDIAAKIQKEKAILEDVVESYNTLKDMVDELDILIEYAMEEDGESAKEAVVLFKKLKVFYKEIEQRALLSGENDQNNAIVAINAGAGGTESCDWAQMLHRMICRFCEEKKFKVQILDVQTGDSAGIKSSTMLISGVFAYGTLKSETGVHRLVRISPFDSQNRRHTSFASIFVGPELDDDVEIEVKDKDIKIDVYRSGGAGGQSVNTTDSAVRITHFESGIVVTCQNERSQLQNKLFAMKVLKSRLYEKVMAERKVEKDKIENEKKEIGWGAQIRSYVLHPYKMVKDHRTNFEMGSAEKVLDGDIDGFIKAFLQWQVSRNTEE